MSASLIDRLLAADAPPQGASPAQRALWFDLHGDWEAAHRAVEEPTDAVECLVHAYLHRVQGDNGNAAYWYRRAGAAVCRDTPRQEQAALAQRLYAGDALPL